MEQLEHKPAPVWDARIVTMQFSGERIFVLEDKILKHPVRLKK